MYVVMGIRNCSRCQIVMRVLDSKGISYSYKDIDQEDSFSKEELLKRAEEAEVIGYPIILDEENRITDFQDLLKR